jgi:gliding motility-associated-like protein
LTLLNGTQIDPVGHYELFDAEGILRAEATGEYNEHGNDSWAYPQRGIDYITRDQFGYDNALHHEVFPSKDRDEYQRIILKAAASDNYPFENGGAHIRDAYVQSLSQVAGLDLDERTHQSCILFANGEYWGVYEMREKVDDSDFTSHYYDQDEPYVDFLKTWGGTWADYGQIAPWTTFSNYVLDPGTDITDPAVYQGVYDQFNTQSIIDYFILNSFVVCADWLNWNTGWWRGTQPGSDPVKWRYILWDMDATFDHYVNFTGVPDQGATADICDPEVLGDPGGQGHVPIWNKLLENDAFLAQYVQRFADLINGPFDCAFMQAHLDSIVGAIEPEMPRHIDRWGGDMAEWEGNVQNIRDFIAERCMMVSTSIVDCYEGVEGPYQLTVLADLPEGGRVRVNTTLVEEFPWTGIYFGGLELPLEAIAKPGYEFTHWTMGNHVLSPSVDSSMVTVMLNSNDTIVAHFVSSFSYDIVFKVNPELSGKIVVNGDTLHALPDTLSLGGLVAHSIEAVGAPGYIFSHWTKTFTNTITPDMESPVADLTLSFWGEVTAHFYPYNPEVIFNVMPEGTGTITIDEETVETYPDTRILLGNNHYNLVATPIDAFHTFDFWESINNPILPDIFDREAGISFLTTDYIIAHFRELASEQITIDTRPRNVGKIILDYDTTLADFPFSHRYLDTKSYSVEVMDNDQYEFSHWELNYHSSISGSEAPFLTFGLTVSDTLTAVFEERLPGIYIPSAFSPNGDGFNEIFFVKGAYLDPSDFKMTIVNRWGETLFETTDITDGWRGELMGTEYFVPVDVYVYKIRYKNSLTGESKEVFGNVTLIR